MYSLQNGRLVNLEEEIEQLIEQVKNKLIEYLVKNHNIDWLDDIVERKMYELLWEMLEPLLMGRWWLENVES